MNNTPDTDEFSLVTPDPETTYNKKLIHYWTDDKVRGLYIMQPDPLIEEYEIWSPYFDKRFGLNVNGNVNTDPRIRNQIFLCLSTHNTLPAAKLAFRLIASTMKATSHD
jgi:hypothetical protein